MSRYVDCCNQKPFTTLLTHFSLPSIFLFQLELPSVTPTLVFKDLAVNRVQLGNSSAKVQFSKETKCPYIVHSYNTLACQTRRLDAASYDYGPLDNQAKQHAKQAKNMQMK
ncbi:hypothetical protein VPH35_027917 [Triticum aestivum]